MRHGSGIDPPNRFQPARHERSDEHLEWEDETFEDGRRVEFLTDASRSIVSTNESPDVFFRFSLNPYRGCQHGCAYCYARNTHEYLGFNAGLDFETKIVVKHDAPELFREFLSNDVWTPDLVVFSGVTDCYQPAERRFELTRKCLQVALDCRLPISIITKNALVVRDLDLLKEMAALRLIHVNLSVTTLRADLARDLEPQTSVPAARLRAIERLSAAGIPTKVMTAPIIPGLNDSEIPAVLKAARDAGAQSAGWVLLRLPITVEPVFREWLHRTQPLAARKIEGLIRETRGGALNESTFGRRLVGSGPVADQIRALFQLFARKHQLDQPLPELDFSQFRPALPRSGQKRLF